MNGLRIFGTLLEALGVTLILVSSARGPWFEGGMAAFVIGLLACLLGRWEDHCSLQEKGSEDVEP